MKPLILVYVDDPMCSLDCADAMLDVLNQSGLYNAKLIGPSSYPELEFNKENVYKANCLVFPGGEGDADQFDNNLVNHKQMVAEYVSNGGKYLGICQGAYFASKHFFDLLDNIVAKQHIKRKKASVKRSGPAVVPISWKGKEPQPIYFHDGAAFVPPEEGMDLGYCKVLATYQNKEAAALIQRYWDGAIGVIGPHPEAMKWWFYSQSTIKDEWKTGIQHWMLLDMMEEIFKF
jgi:glutamine amidotransferase-like uncharacterized protein